MASDTLHLILGNAWTVILVILFFDGTIFVHELGHYVAARHYGVKVDSFSIGFGPAVWTHRARNGVKWRLNLIPFGGYVLLPQIANLEAVEGKSETDASKLTPVAYGPKMIILVAGAFFQIVFAFALACVIWVVGQPESSLFDTTRIGYVSSTVDLADGSSVASPASQAGLRAGDVVLEVDHRKVSDWDQLKEDITMSSGRGRNDQPRAVFTIQRGPERFDLIVYPRIAGPDGFRQVGIEPALALNVEEVAAGSPAGRAGLKPGDEIVSLDGVPVLSPSTFADILYNRRSKPVAAGVRRAGRPITLTFAAEPALKPDADWGLGFSPGMHVVHPSPIAQIRDQVAMMIRALASLINPHTDIGLSAFSGPIGIVHMLSASTHAGLAAILAFTILLNVNLAIINLLPIPIFDGGHILFATIGRIRGRPLPTNLVAGVSGVFFVLIICMFLYMSVLDVRRWRNDSAAARPQAPPAAPAPAKP